MMLKKELIVRNFIAQQVVNAKYVIEVSDDKYKSKSTLTFDDETLEKHEIKPSINLLGKKIMVSLKSSKYERGGLEKDDLLIGEVEKIETKSWTYSTVPPMTDIYIHYIASFSTPSSGGSISIASCPSYKLRLEINEREYNKLKKLSKKTIMKADFKLK